MEHIAAWHSRCCRCGYLLVPVSNFCCNCLLYSFLKSSVAPCHCLQWTGSCRSGLCVKCLQYKLQQSPTATLHVSHRHAPACTCFNKKRYEEERDAACFCAKISGLSYLLVTGNQRPQQESLRFDMSSIQEQSNHAHVLLLKPQHMEQA